MIFDTLTHSTPYAALSPLFAAGLEYLQAFDPHTPDGKYPIVGDDLFAVVQRYDSAPTETKAWEAHRIYADIQYIVSGHEKMLYAPLADLGEGLPYVEAKDVQKWPEHPVPSATSIIVGPGQFTIFYPQDAHKPGCQLDAPEAIVKVVLKVRVA